MNTSSPKNIFGNTLRVKTPKIFESPISDIVPPVGGGLAGEVLVFKEIVQRHVFAVSASDGSKPRVLA